MTNPQPEPKKEVEQRMGPVPEHIAIICDGNRRWAKSQGLKVFAGHKKAVHENFEELIDHSIKIGLKYLTFWIFSTENWKRDKVEVDFLMNLFREIFDKRIDGWKEKGVKFNMIGNISGFADDIQSRILDGEEKTQENDLLTVTLAMNYGGRDELTRTMQKLAKKVVAGDIQPEDITQEMIAQNLDTAGMPDPACIVRTSGEFRMSGFMSWQQNYSEFIFVDYTFPELHAKELEDCIREFNRRNRRFGGG
jgi:undecaprenyl diphosphate synthase